MANGIERPLDLLNTSKGKEVLVHLKGDKFFVGTLLAFDIHINLVLDNVKEMHEGEVKKSLGLTSLVLGFPSQDANDWGVHPHIIFKKITGMSP